MDDLRKLYHCSVTIEDSWSVYLKDNATEKDLDTMANHLNNLVAYVEQEEKEEFGASPVGFTFVAEVSEECAVMLRKVEGFVPIKVYPVQSQIDPREIGCYGNIRFLIKEDKPLQEHEVIITNEDWVKNLYVEEPKDNNG